MADESTDGRSDVVPIFSTRQLRGRGAPRPLARVRGFRSVGRGLWTVDGRMGLRRTAWRAAEPEGAWADEPPEWLVAEWEPEWEAGPPAPQWNQHLERARAVASTIPDSAFAHQTAAMFHGMPLPRHDGRIHLHRRRGTSRSRRREVKTWRADLPCEEIVTDEKHGVRVLSPRETLLSLCQTETVETIVAIIDWLVRHPRPAFERRIHPYDTLDGLRSWAETRSRRKGVVVLREALRRARVGADSPQETRLRLALEDAGLPVPECNPVLFARPGQWGIQPDLAFPEFRVAVDYQGASHGAAEQMRRDVDKRRRFAAEGWTLVEVHAGHARNTWAAAVLLVSQALRRRGWRPSPSD